MRVFISFSYSDRETVVDLANKIALLSERVWLSEWEMRAGDSLISKIDEALSSSDFVFVVISEASVKSNWVQKEVRIAQAYAVEGKIKRVIPVLLDSDASVSDLPFLQDILYLDATRGVDGQEFLRKLKFALEYSLKDADATPIDSSLEIKVQSMNVWDICFLEQGNPGAIFEVDPWNKSVEIFLDGHEYKIVEIPIDHLTMVELASAKELLGWRVLTLVEQDDEKIRIAVGSRSELLCLHYRDHNGMPGMKTWLVGDSLQQRMEKVRSYVFGD